MTSVWCRICHVGNTRLIDVKKKLLLILYENLTKSKFNSEDGRSRALCSFCYQKLLRCHKFSQMAIRSEKIISDLHDKGFQINEGKLNINQLLPVAAMPLINIENATNAGSQVTKVELLPCIDIKEEVTTEPDPFVVEVCTRSLKLEDDNNGQGNDVEEHLVDIHVEQNKPDDSKMPFSCNNCHKIFYKKGNLISHMRNSHDQPTRKQYSSTRNDTEATSMFEDITIHCQKHKLASHVCDKTVNTKSHLIRLKNTHTGEKSFACNVCDNQYRRKHSLVEHMRTHTGEKPYACNVCKKQFNRKQDLVRHVSTHTGEKPFTCNVCDNQYRRKQNLVRHMRTHTGEKPFVCNVCDSKFSRKHNLVKHTRTHTGEKPFACNVCDNKFNQKHNLVRHMRTHTVKVQHVRTHTGEKPFACNVCDNKFSRKHNLVRHMRTHTGEVQHVRTHTSERPFACNVCHNKFSRKRNLVRHMITHTGEKPFACNLCEKRYNLKQNLVQHMRSHS